MSTSKTPKHLLKATGKSSQFVAKKSSGPVSKDNAPGSNGTQKLNPYTGKKCC